jgi:two-component system, NarL family, nitrate/nitrite response regulator NarP
MIRVVFVSDQPLSTLGLRTLLSDQEEFNLVGEFTSDDDVVAGIEKLKPDILILDCYLLSNPSEFIVRQIKAANLNLTLFALNQIIDEQHFFSLIDAGVRGYLLTHEPLDMMVDSIRDVAGGAFRISDELENFLSTRQPPPQDVKPNLTERERQVLNLVVLGYTNAQIAEQLHISLGTVKNHSKNIYRKLNVHTRVEAVLSGLKHGLVEI